MNENDEQIENNDLSVETVEDKATDISEQESDVSALVTSADQQDAQLQQFAVDFILKVIRLRGVQITRDDFLRQELRRSGYSDEVIENALASTPRVFSAKLLVLKKPTRRSHTKALLNFYHDGRVKE